MTRGLGYLPDRPDDRDRVFRMHPAATTTIPPSASVDVPIIAPKDQGQSSSCVGQAWSQALRLAYLKQGRSCPQLSALYVYRTARNIDGSAGDDGTYLRSGASAIQRLGAALETVWPFALTRVNAQPTFAADHSAYDRSGIRSYHRVANWDEVRASLAAGLPVVGGWSVDEEFVSGDGTAIVDVQDQAHIAGGHAIAIVGYSDDTATLLNSWGPGYGNNGRFRATSAFISEGTDLWALDVTGESA